jgi:hypothetical protein
MEPEGLLPHSQIPATCPCPDHSNPVHALQIDSFKIHFNVIFPFTSVSSKSPLSLRVSHQNATWTFFYACGSVRQWSILIPVQRDATQSSLFIIMQIHSTCLRYQPHLSSGVHKTVTNVSDNGHIFCATTSIQCGQVWPHWREVAAIDYFVLHLVGQLLI